MIKIGIIIGSTRPGRVGESVGRWVLQVAQERKDAEFELVDIQDSENELRQGFWRAGHAHAGVLLLLSLVVLRFVDEANLSKKLKIFARYATPTAAILIPAAFFLSVIPKNATEPNALIYLGYVGAIILAAGSIVLGIGLLKKTS